jgi:hypothetical protein
MAQRDQIGPEEAVMDATPAQVNHDDEEERHPALRLFDALNFLHSTCCSADSFQDLAKRRRASGEFRDSMARVVGEAAAERANQRIRDGEHPFEVLDEFAEADRIADRLPVSDNPQSLDVLQSILTEGRDLCLRARDALREGGADVLEAHVAPTRSIDITKKVMEADGLFLKLGVGLSDPSFVIDEDAAAMAALAGYFEQQRIELSAALERRGLSSAQAPEGAAPATAKVPSREFTDMERNALRALLELKAFDLASRKRIDKVSEKAGYGTVAGGSFKQAISSLVRQQLLGSKSGRSGGVWLNPAGRAAMENGTGNGAY